MPNGCSRASSQGFIHHDLSRACLAQAIDSIPRVVLLGRLSLYGQRAERLHEELVPITARWIELSLRKGPLGAYARDAEARTLDLLERSLGDRGPSIPGKAIQRKLLDAAPQDIEEGTSKNIRLWYVDRRSWSRHGQIVRSSASD